jgi:mitogen-activated protein kinase 1/3
VVSAGYDVEKIIGVGSYGSVCRAVQRATGRRVAIKRMANIFEDEIDCKRILREITLLRKISHPSIVKIVEILEPRDHQNFNTIYVVMEYMESDLKKIIRSPINLDLLHVSTILFRLCQAVKHLHDLSVIHRDLKPANVLIKEDCSVKLCDFGLAR